MFPANEAAVCGNWLALPIREASSDLVIGDGSINCLTYPAGVSRTRRDSLRTAPRQWPAGSALLSAGGAT